MWPYYKTVTKSDMQRERCVTQTLIFGELPIIKTVDGSDKRLRRKLWKGFREKWDYSGGSEEPEPVGDED